MSNLSALARTQVQESAELDIITFAQSKQGLNVKLFASQRALLKILKHEELDDTVRDVEIRDKFNKKIIGTYTERGFFEYLRETGRISIPYEEYLESKFSIVQINLVMGRRASKSTIIGILAAYDLYRVLRIHNPQDYFKIVETDSMDGVFIALGEDNATKLFAKFTKLISKSPLFKPHLLEKPSGTQIRIWTKRNLEILAQKGRAGRADALSNSITIRAMANSPQVRGDNNLFVIMEEFAHYNSSSSSTRDNPLDNLIYEAAVPSVSGFKNPDGTPFGKAYIISSPNGKKGKFWSEIEASKRLGAKSGSVTIEAATWEINPSISPAFLESQYYKNISSYAQEYGAEFIDGGLAWLKDLDILYRAFSSTLYKNAIHLGQIKTQYFAGVDFALSNDGTAVTVSHFEPRLKRLMDDLVIEAHSYNEKSFLEEFCGIARDSYIVDYSEVRYAGAPPYENRKTLLISEVLDWIVEVYKRFPIQAGMYDQWSGEIIKQLVAERGLKRLELVTHTAAINSAQYKLFEQLLHMDALVLPFETSLKTELLGLQVEHRSNELINVSAPPGATFHDDRFDSLIRSLYLNFAYHTKNLEMSSSLNMEYLMKRRVDGSSSGTGLSTEDRRRRVNARNGVFDGRRNSPNTIRRR